MDLEADGGGFYDFSLGDLDLRVEASLVSVTVNSGAGPVRLRIPRNLLANIPDDDLPFSRLMGVMIKKVGDGLIATRAGEVFVLAD